MSIKTNLNKSDGQTKMVSNPFKQNKIKFLLILGLNFLGMISGVEGMLGGSLVGTGGGTGGGKLGVGDSSLGGWGTGE